MCNGASKYHCKGEQIISALILTVFKALLGILPNPVAFEIDRRYGYESDGNALKCDSDNDDINLITLMEICICSNEDD